MKDAFTALLKSAGYKWNGAEWIETPGKIDHTVIEKAYEDGKLTEDQYNMVQLAAGIMSDAEQKKENLFKVFLEEIQKASRIKTQVQVDIVNRAWEWVSRKCESLFKKKENSFLMALKINENIKEKRRWGDNESHCDEYCEAVLKSANKLPSDYIVSWNDNGKRKDSFMEFYRSKLKNAPEPGWNIMLMDGHTRQGKVLPPHMVVLYARNDGLIDFSHYTSDAVVKPRVGWTIKEITETGKGPHDRLGYSNFKYLPLGK